MQTSYEPVADSAKISRVVASCWFWSQNAITKRRVSENRRISLRSSAGYSYKPAKRGLDTRVCVSVDEPRLLPSSSVPCTEEPVRYSGKNPGDGRWVHGVHQPPPGHGSRHWCSTETLNQLYRHHTEFTDSSSSCAAAAQICTSLHHFPFMQRYISSSLHFKKCMQVELKRLVS